MLPLQSKTPPTQFCIVRFWVISADRMLYTCCSRDGGPREMQLQKNEQFLCDQSKCILFYRHRTRGILANTADGPLLAL